MSRLKSCFERLKKHRKNALIPFITAGDPDLAASLTIMHSLVESGADIIELGIPFSDPMAEGPVIQKACERALAHGTNLVDVLALVEKFRSTNSITPVVLMGYVNPVESMGYANFCKAAKEAGVDGVLLVDLPPEEASDLFKAALKYEIDVILLVAPTTDRERIKIICNMASGFIYYVSLKGITGAAQLDVSEVEEHVAEIKPAARVPVVVGFGIKNAETAAAIARFSDGVVIGSALVNIIGENSLNRDKLLTNVNKKVREIRVAIDGTIN